MQLGIVSLIMIESSVRLNKVMASIFFIVVLQNILEPSMVSMHGLSVIMLTKKHVKHTDSVLIYIVLICNSFLL